MSDKTLFTWGAFHAFEDGTTGNVNITVGFDEPSRKFTTVIPDYIVKALELKVSLIESSDSEGVLEMYATVCDDYSRWRLTRKADKMLWIGRMVGIGDFARDTFGVDKTVAMGIRPVFAVYNEHGAMDHLVLRGGDDKVGERIHTEFARNPILLPDTPEVREQAQALIDSIGAAASILAGVSTAVDPLAYFMQIGPGFRPPADPVPEQAALPFDNPSPTPVVEDDEL